MKVPLLPNRLQRRCILATHPCVLQALPFNLPTQQLKHPAASPGVAEFAFIAGLEALVRGSTLAAFPLLMYRAWGDAQRVSELYFVVGLISLLTALAVPLLAQRLQRRWVYVMGLSLYVMSAAWGMLGGKWVAVALLCNTMAAATAFVCFNAYVLDHVAKSEFARLESLRMFYGSLGWVVGPAAGVYLLRYWHGAPFLMAGLGASAILLFIWKIRLGNGRVMCANRLAPPIRGSTCNAFSCSPG
jgi:predicted MFS family arabinose efflux permease